MLRDGVCSLIRQVFVGSAGLGVSAARSPRWTACLAHSCSASLRRSWYLSCGHTFWCTMPPATPALGLLVRILGIPLHLDNAGG